MTIDETDYAPRPADDWIAGLTDRTTFWLRMNSAEFFRLANLVKAPSQKCWELGCDFSELPHAI